MKKPNLERRTELLELCFECFCKNGLEDSGVKKLAAYCGIYDSNLFNYFESKDQIIVESTAHCMEKVEDEFMSRAPQNPEELLRFVREAPYWTAERHGAKYRFMYQVYSSPQYIEYGKKFFKGVNERYAEYARSLSPKLNIPEKKLLALILTFVRACVHYAMFEEENYLQLQLMLIEEMINLAVKRTDTSKTADS